MVALDKQFFYRYGLKPQGRGRWRDESWQAGKSPGRQTAGILSARRHRDTSNSSNTSCANEIIYCGYRFDSESQLYYVRNRTYNPALGRWIQRDPIGYVSGDNLYEYAGGNSATRLDPSGLFWPFGSTPTCNKWSCDGSPIRIMKKTYRWTSIVKRGQKPGPWGWAAFWHWLKTSPARAVSQQADFEVAAKNEVDLELEVIGPREPEPGEEEGEPDEGTLLSLKLEQSYFTNPSLHLIWLNRGRLVGATCRKKFYFIQQCKCCGPQGTAGETKTFYFAKLAYGKTEISMGHLFCGGTEGRVIRLKKEADRMNTNHKSICGSGTGRKPSGLVPFNPIGNLGVSIDNRPYDG